MDIGETRSFFVNNVRKYNDCIYINVNVPTVIIFKHIVVQKIANRIPPGRYFAWIIYVY